MALHYCKTPLRISFAGGGTDVVPYRSQFGGCTLNTTIDKYAHVSCRPRDDGVIQVEPLYEAARNHGAIGGKLLGAGGQAVDFNFDHHGAVTWCVSE